MRATSRRSAPSSPSRSVSPRRDLGGQGPASTCRGPPPADLLLRLDDLAALGLAVGRRRLGVALTLAAVLAGAGVARARTAALPLAGVDAVADHLVTAGLLLGPGADGTGQEQHRGRTGHEQTLRVHPTSFGFCDAWTRARRTRFQLLNSRWMRGTRPAAGSAACRPGAEPEERPARASSAARRAAAMAARPAASSVWPTRSSSSVRSSIR